jgi:hypothetical protein
MLGTHLDTGAGGFVLRTQKQTTALLCDLTRGPDDRFEFRMFPYDDDHLVTYRLGGDLAKAELS